MDFYDRMNQLLKQKHKTRKQLCNATGINYHTLTSMFQRRSRGINTSTIQKIATYLEVSMEYLVSGSSKYILEESMESLEAYQTEMESELLRLYKKLSVKDKSIILLKLYEMIEKNNQ